MDLQFRDLESLKARISHEESYLREGMPEQDIQDDPLDQGAEAEMHPISRADDAPSESTTAPVYGSPPSEDPVMEVDEGAVGMPLLSPVSREDDNLLSGNDAAGVEADLAHLTISSPVDKTGRERKPPSWRCLPLWRKFNFRTDDHS